MALFKQKSISLDVLARTDDRNTKRNDNEKTPIVQRSSGEKYSLDEDAYRYRCLCGWCRCCHIQTACIVICIIELIVCIGEVINGSYVLSLLDDTWSTGSVIGIYGIYIAIPILFGVAILMVFVAVATVKPGVVVPHLVMQVTVMLVQLVVSILVILWFAGVTDMVAPLVTGSQDATNHNSPSEYLLFSLSGQRNHDPAASQNVDAGIAVAIAIMLLLVLAFEVWLVWLFVRLYRYLGEKNKIQ